MQCIIPLSDNTGGNKMLKLETAKMQNAIEKAKEVHPKVIRMTDGAYMVRGHEKTYVVKLNKAKGLYLGECHCDGYEFGNICYHIAAACALHIGIKRGYSKESPAPRRGLLHLDGWAGRRRYPVEIIGETPKKYEVRAIVEMQLPGRSVKPGETDSVPKKSVTFNHPLAGVLVKQEGGGMLIEGSPIMV